MKQWHCGRYQLELGRKTWIMGIVNATPDSFSGDGISSAKAIERGLRMIEDGATLLDIGGESTRPGSAPVALDEELKRVLPVVEGLIAADADVPLSVDTTKSEVARRALEAGASVINDISGATFDPQMLEICAQSQCGVALMHLRGTPQTMGWSRQTPDVHSDVIAEVLAFWDERLRAARAVGIEDNRLCFDAGFGFGKSVEENLELIRRGRELAAFGFPTLSGTSRKSTLGRILDGAPVEDRLFGTAATVALAIQHGADIVRVHDVKEMAQVARVADALCRN
ncbi:dihydropteroate synthase [Abditibacteriota bacterium]|nr:dihydropteroate synthase [Abditibacteriota bacterium]